jgi:hypothetical protein
VLWSLFPEARPTPPSVKASVAADGRPFRPPATIADGALLEAAAFSGSALTFATNRGPGAPGPSLGLGQQVLVAGAGASPFEVVDDHGGFNVLDEPLPGHAGTLLAWQHGSGRTLYLQTFGGLV